MASCGRPNQYWLMTGALKLVDGLCRILTLGFWQGPNLEFKFVLWAAQNRVWEGSARQRQK